jgi:predicted ribosome quality control (RQC) complex YloA/Tae2 family protein
MLTLSELRHVVRVLDATRIGARIDKVVQSDPSDLVLHLSGGNAQEPGDRSLLLLSSRPKTARISELPKSRKAPPQPAGFAQYLKAHVEGGRLREVTLEGDDRQVRFGIETRKGRYSILFSILGPRSNLYALDAGDVLMATARPLAETRRDLALNAPWSSPEGGPPKEGADRFADASDDALLGAIEAHYSEAEAEAGEQQFSSRLTKALKKQNGTLSKKVRLLEEDLAAGDEAPRWERLGELLKTRIREVKPGMTEIEVADFETGEPAPVPLEPKLSAQKNLELLFKRARKAEKRARKAANDIDTARARLAANEALREEIGAATPERMAEIAEQPEVSRLLDRYFPAPKIAEDAPKKKVWKVGKRELPTRLIPKRYATESGLEVWVGKNDEGNDILTTRLARGNDLFFHLEGDPGSHVVLRTEGKGKPPDDSLLEAAELAVNFSKAKNAPNAPVHIAEIKDITKPSGAKPGLVYVHRGRTIQLRRSEERLKRILGNRIDE